MLKVDNLSISFSNSKEINHVVNDISFSLEKGESIAIVGESGSGKSLTALSILRLIDEAIVQGSIKFNDQELTQLSERQLEKVRGNDIAMIFQEPMNSLNPVFTIGKQIEECLVIHTKYKHPKNLVLDLLKKVGFSDVEELYHKYPHELSGGMRQRVMIAIALSCNPALLIADEPTTALDVTTQAQILRLIKQLTRANDSSLILITHDLGIVSYYVDRVLVMYYGSIVEDLPIDALNIKKIKHPYTKALLDASEKMIPIHGQIPSFMEQLDGCSFAPRCTFATTKCHQQKPLLSQGTHRFACFHPLGDNNDLTN